MRQKFSTSQNRYSGSPNLLVCVVLVACFVEFAFSGTLSILNRPHENICNKYCDGKPSGEATNPRDTVSVDIFGRTIRVVVSDDDNMGYGAISNGDPADQIWLDRSFDGGATWAEDSRLGFTVIPDGSRGVSTLSFNIDKSDITNKGIGALRACGKANDRDEIACTAWVRSRVLAETRVEAAATALMMYYNAGGLWSTTGWWNSANCLQALVDYMRATGSSVYRYAIERTFELNKGQDFTNEYVDDTGWWGLVWVAAFDLKGDVKYLDMAQKDSDFMYATRDDQCGGGVWWTTNKDYKNAIANELFIKLAASLHNRIPGDSKYLNQALEVWNWFEGSGMINSDSLINDGLTSDCRNNGFETWTYNQGVILGALVELSKATQDSNYISTARRIADAVLASSRLNPGNILFEPCETNGGDCGGDGPSFKGIFVRNLGELNRFLPDRPYSSYLGHLADVIYERNRNSLDQYGVHYAGPFVASNGATQHSGFEVLTAAL